MKSKKLIALTMAVAIATSTTGSINVMAVPTTMNNSIVAALPSPSIIGGTITDAIKKYTTSYTELPTKYDVSKTKNFEVKFNREIDFISVNSNTVKVVDSKGNEVSIKLTPKTTDKTVVIVEAPTGGYKEGETYAVIVKKRIGSVTNLNLSNETVMKFVIAASGSTGGSTTPITSGITLNPQNEIIATYTKDINQSTFNTGNIVVKDASGSKQYVEITFTDSKTAKISASKTYPLVPGTYTLSMANLKYKDGSAVTNVNNTFKIAGEEQITVLQAVKDFSGGKIYKETYLDFYATSGDYLQSGQWSQIKEAFNIKYNSPKYDYIKNIDYYKDMNGLTINFNKVNNENKHSGIENIKIGSTGKFLGLPLSNGEWLPEKNYHSNIVGRSFIWRPDIEQELALLINAERRSLGLKEITVDANLSAISKWAAKRQHFGSSYFETQALGGSTNILTTNAYNDYYSLTIKVPTLAELDKGVERIPNNTSKFRVWPQNITPYISAEGLDYYNNGVNGSYNAEMSKKYYYSRLENEVYSLFNLSNTKKIYTVKYNTILHNDAASLMKRFKDNPYLGYTSDKWYNPRDNDRTGYFVVNIIDIIKNPNITKVGIGCIYQSPLGKADVNGMTGIYMLAQ